MHQKEEKTVKTDRNAEKYRLKNVSWTLEKDKNIFIACVNQVYGLYFQAQRGKGCLLLLHREDCGFILCQLVCRNLMEWQE